MDNIKSEIIRLWNEEKLSIVEIEKRLGISISLNEDCNIPEDMCCGNFSYQKILLG